MKADGGGIASTNGDGIARTQKTNIGKGRSQEGEVTEESLGLLLCTDSGIIMLSSE